VGPPSDNGDAVNLLGKHGVLSPELASSLRTAAAFRNVLVHEYVEVSDDVVVTRLNRSLGHSGIRPRGHDLDLARGGHHTDLIVDFTGHHLAAVSKS
jgi:hypothetical protein